MIHTLYILVEVHYLNNAILTEVVVTSSDDYWQALSANAKCIIKATPKFINFRNTENTPKKT